MVRQAVYTREKEDDTLAALDYTCGGEGTLGLSART